MSRPASQSRRSSASSNGGGGGGSGGANSRLGAPYETEAAAYERGFDFCNAFWVEPGRKDSHTDWGKEGVDNVLGRMKQGGKTLDDLRMILKERVAMEEDYAKRLNKLSKNAVGNGETGHLERAIQQMKEELVTMSKAHVDLAGLLRQQELQLADFYAKRESARKNQQLMVEKAWKNKILQNEYVLKAKGKYENDAITINALNAQASLLQGRDLDKATMKLDKAQQTVQTNENDYRKYVGVLKETTSTWNMQWKTFCDLCQDQEEDRLDFLKSRLWDWANALSTMAMAEDESAERLRTALEQCDAVTDVKIFVQQFGTGSSIPDPPVFVDYSRKEMPPKQSFRTANFMRSSTRLPGVTHSPSAVGDVLRAFKAHSDVTGEQSQFEMTNSGSRSGDLRNAEELEAGKPKSHGPSPASTQPLHRSLENLQVDTNHSSWQSQQPDPSSRMGGSSDGENAFASRSQDSQALNSSPASRFTPSTGRTSRYTANSELPLTTPTSPKPGFAPASSFQRRPQTTTGLAQDATATSKAPVPRLRNGSMDNTIDSSPKPVATDQDENDPLLQALHKLEKTQPQTPTRAQRSSANQAPNRSTYSNSANLAVSHSQPQQYGQVGTGTQATSHSPGRSRPDSRPPSPSAAMMKAPPQNQIPAVVDHYGQAFPGERTSRPSSRQDLNVPGDVKPAARDGQSSSSFGPQNIERAASPQPFVGVGARGRSPSPQPYNGPQNGLQVYPLQQQPQPQHMPQRQSQSPISYQPPQQVHATQTNLPSRVAGYYQGSSQSMPQLQRDASPVQTSSGYRSQQQYGQGLPTTTSPAQNGHPYGLGTPQTTSEASAAYPSTSSRASQQYASGIPPVDPRLAALSPGSQHYSSPVPQQFGRTAPSPVSQISQSQSFSYGSPSSYSSVAAHGKSQYGQQVHMSPSPYPINAAPQQGYQAPSPAAQSYQTANQPSAIIPSAPAGYQSTPLTAHQYHQQAPSGYQTQPDLNRSSSMQSGVSGISGASRASQYIQSPSVYGYSPASQHVQQSPAAAPSPAPVQQAPTTYVPTSNTTAVTIPTQPTGQYTDDGKPILFYVNALYDYKATGPEEFNFSQGDVISVTGIDPDGWWQGKLIGVASGGNIFPSNFVEILS